MAKLLGCLHHVLFVVIVFGIPGSLLSQERQEIEYETRETEHFILKLEVSEKKYYATLEETERMLEQLWILLDQKIGAHCLPDTANDRENPMGDASSDNNMKCKVYLFQTNHAYLKETKGKRRDYSTSFYSYSPETIYLSPNASRRTLIHEAVHYYCDKTFPGEYTGYPGWFQEIFALFYEQHTWDGENLQIGQFPALLMGRRWNSKDVKDVLCRTLETMPPSDSDKHGIDLNQLTYHRFASGGVRFIENEEGFKNQNSAYRVWQVFANYLFLEKPDVPNETLRFLAKNSKFKKNYSLTTHLEFMRACRSLTKSKPIYMEDMIQWIDDHPNYFYVWKGVHYDTAEGFITKNDFSFGLNGDFNRSPRLRIDCQAEDRRAGIVVNAFNRDKQYKVLMPNGDDSIALLTMGLESNKYKKLETINVPQPISSGDYQWYAERNGETVDIYIDDMKVYSTQMPESEHIGMVIPPETSVRIESRVSHREAIAPDKVNNNEN